MIHHKALAYTPFSSHFDELMSAVNVNVKQPVWNERKRKATPTYA